MVYGLRNKKVDHSLDPAPAKSEQQREWCMNLVLRCAHRGCGIRIGKYRKVVAVWCFGSHNVVVHYMTSCAHVTVWNNWAIWVAEQARVHPREVAKVGKVFELA